jgi:hypothetical protein
MASMKHEELVILLRNHPGLVPELLQGALGVELPKWSELGVESSDFTQVVPTEYRADMVVLLKRRRPVFAGVVEVQLSRSSRKRRNWPVYLASLHARLRCPVVLLVVAPDEAVARWCARPIHLGHPGFVLQPLVVGPEAIRVLQGKQGEGQSAELMRSSIYEYQSEFARRYVAQGLEQGQRQGREEGRREGFQQGLQEGRQEERQEGLQRGREEGHLEGERQALLKVLEARGLGVEGAARRRLLACTDLAQLERWLGQAVTVQSVQELFTPKSRSKPVVRAAGARVKARRPRVRR